eukprot:TRINITY_DN20713_c0_g1_i1.p1 TRINITY_DN20713_c0_g1~~TRINITY_DN20713_c0_g1_i1.p1  ORF type:complete len:703 (+),score=143.26 TRINITY_DN20713_c0_g1_i1:60-2168(+)
MAPLLPFATTEPPLDLFQRSSDHPLAEEVSRRVRRRDGAVTSVAVGDSPIRTSAWWTNLLVGREHPTYVLPYAVRVAAGVLEVGVPGMRRQLGPKEHSAAGEAGYYVHQFVDDWRFALPSDAVVSEGGRLHCTLDCGGQASVPLVAGMSWVSVRYSEACRALLSTRHAVLSHRARSDGVLSVDLNDGTRWLLAASPQPPGGFRVEGPEVRLPSGWAGWLRVAVVPEPDSEDGVAASAAAVVESAELSADVDDRRCELTFTWKRSGDAGSVLHYALQHHCDALSHGAERAFAATLPSPTQGPMIALRGGAWVMSWEVHRPGWLPGGLPSDERLRRVLRKVAKDELAAFDPERPPSDPSLYFSGKTVWSHAQLCMLGQLLADRDAGDDGLRDAVAAGARALRQAVEGIVRRGGNRIVYDSTFGGLIGRNGLSDRMADFGNSMYNDHAFHYGYHVGAVAALVELRSSTDAITEWARCLARDYANPSADDRFFPVSRHFDWFAGHGWAQGLFAGGDGKDMESCSEEIHSSYALRLFAASTGDGNMARAADALLAVGVAGARLYYMPSPEDALRVHPPAFAANLAPGILFQGKVHYTTWFSPKLCCIHGIQMLPVTPALALCRTPRRAKAEWEVLAAEADRLPGEGGDTWESLLRCCCHAEVDPSAAVRRLAVCDIEPAVSRTYALLWATTRGCPLSEDAVRALAAQ